MKSISGILVRENRSNLNIEGYLTQPIKMFHE